MTIEELIDSVGGEQLVAYHLDLHQQTVRRWAHSGIPEHHWRRLIDLSRDELSAEDLLEANEQMRRVNGK